jgi:hypothetical protein
MLPTHTYEPTIGCPKGKTKYQTPSPAASAPSVAVVAGRRHARKIRPSSPRGFASQVIKVTFCHMVKLGLGLGTITTMLTNPRTRAYNPESSPLKPCGSC